jgi:hypothetical protein
MRRTRRARKDAWRLRECLSVGWTERREFLARNMGVRERAASMCAARTPPASARMAAASTTLSGGGTMRWRARTGSPEVRAGEAERVRVRTGGGGSGAREGLARHKMEMLRVRTAGDVLTERKQIGRRRK